jgi:ech hydrogenase subunit A
MNLIAYLILAPLAFAVAVLASPAALRDAIVRVGAALVIAGSLALPVVYPVGETTLFAMETHRIDGIVLLADLAIAVLLFAVGLKFRRGLVSVLAVAQAAMLLAAERGGHHVAQPLFLDPLSLIMALIIGVIGGLITWHAIGYMRAYHGHHHGSDDRRWFFAAFFIFLAAMFGLVFANSLTWLFLCWEITTLCSFFLIGYPQNDEAINNAFRALVFNLVGGLGFAGAILYQSMKGGSLALMEMTSAGGAAVLIPAVLIGFAGLTKAAQYPFSSWLLGAMVAPTPVSALLHSSTMVKAGVYAVIRMAPVLQDTMAGLMLALVGGVTFLMASVIAISQSNAKRVLAYSTIANLGLIIACAASGSAQAIWAAILLVIFHAIAKALLFLAVGTNEHLLGSRDIEDMQGLIVKLPKIAFAILVGICGMFLAPFGMLISKWAAMEALIVVNPLLPILICFGSGATLFFWAKWMGKLLAADPAAQPVAWTASSPEKAVIGILVVMTVAMCGGFPVVSDVLIDPYLVQTYGAEHAMSAGNLMIMALMLGLVAMLPASLWYRGGRRTRRVTPYLGGANVAARSQFTGSMGLTRDVAMKNYYLSEVFDEGRLTTWAVGGAIVLILALFMAGGVS